MDAQAFWTVIGNYNKNTIMIQAIFFAFLAIAILLSYTKKVPSVVKVALGAANLYIGVVFFMLYGTQPIQKFFALPLFLAIGALFLYESWKNKNDFLQRPTLFQLVLLILYILYPIISFLLGNRFPEIVTFIMPCPVVSLSIVIYAGYKQKNKLLLLLLTIWGLTGIKSVMFNAYEDIILLICGLYGVVLLVREMKKSSKSL